MAQTSAPDVVVMYSYYSGATAQRTVLHILISRSEGKTESIEVKTRPANPALGAEAYQMAIAKLYREGYKIDGTFSPGRGAESSLVFVKRQ